VDLAPPLSALPTLAPSPAWVDWHSDTGALWPPPDDRDEDLNELVSPGWIDEAARRAVQRLSDSDLPPVVGHVDWWAPNLLWADSSLRAVVDWDSAAALSEAAVVGGRCCDLRADAANCGGEPAFLAGYERTRGNRLSRKEVQVSWAAGSWTRTFDAKKESVDSDGPRRRDRATAEPRASVMRGPSHARPCLRFCARRAVLAVGASGDSAHIHVLESQWRVE
jgi:hypothetical protein